MAKTAEAKKLKAKKEKSPSIENTTSINLNVPTTLYYDIKAKADKETVKSGEKRTIHDQMIADLKKANPKK